MAADTPTGYTSGTVSIAAGTPLQLGPLIQQQVDANASMSAFQFVIQADPANAAPVLIGMSINVGTGSPVQYGREIAPGQDRQYGGGTGNNILVGRFYVYSAAAAVIHIEILP